MKRNKLGEIKDIEQIIRKIYINVATWENMHEEEAVIKVVLEKYS